MSSSSISFKISAPPRPSSSSTSSSIRPTTTHSSSSSKSTKLNQPYRTNVDSDDSDQDSNQKDEFLVSFDKKGANQKAKQTIEGPLIIPSIANKDWREAAELIKKKKRSNRYIPNSEYARPSTTTSTNTNDKVQVDRINDAVVKGGLDHVVLPPKPNKDDDQNEEEKEEVGNQIKVRSEQVEGIEETDEQKALKELISGQDSTNEQISVDVIYSKEDDRNAPIDEVDAFKADLQSRPDESTLEDYARIPVGQFGAAMLRGMGWKPGQSTSKSGRQGPTEAFVPKSRPAMLGIGAKPMNEVLGTDKGAKMKGKGREEMRFVPLARVGNSSTSSNSNTQKSIGKDLEMRNGGETRRRIESDSISSERKRDRDYESSDRRRDERKSSHNDRDHYRDSSSRNSEIGDSRRRRRSRSRSPDRRRDSARAKEG